MQVLTATPQSLLVKGVLNRQKKIADIVRFVQMVCGADVDA